MKVTKILLPGVGVLLLLAGVCLITAGLMIPAERSFENEIEINAPAEMVWQVINDRGKYAEWQTNLTKVEVIDEKNWVEYPKDSPEPLRFTSGKDGRPASMAFEYTMGDSFDGTWYGHVTQTENGVRLETRDAYVTKGWLTKILIYIFFDMDKFAKDWNGKLKQRVESIDH